MPLVWRAAFPLAWPGLAIKAISRCCKCRGGRGIGHGPRPEVAFDCQEVGTGGSTWQAYWPLAAKGFETEVPTSWPYPPTKLAYGVLTLQAGSRLVLFERAVPLSCRTAFFRDATWKSWNQKIQISCILQLWDRGSKTGFANSLGHNRTLLEFLEPPNVYWACSRLFFSSEKRPSIFIDMSLESPRRGHLQSVHRTIVTIPSQSKRAIPISYCSDWSECGGLFCLLSWPTFSSHHLRFAQTR